MRGRQRVFREPGEFKLRAGLAVPLITLNGTVAAVSLGEAVDIASSAHGMIGMISAFAIARAKRRPVTHK